MTPNLSPPPAFVLYRCPACGQYGYAARTAFPDGRVAMLGRGCPCVVQAGLIDFDRAGYIRMAPGPADIPGRMDPPPPKPLIPDGGDVLRGAVARGGVAGDVAARLLAFETLLIVTEDVLVEAGKRVDFACKERRIQADLANATRAPGTEPWAFMTEFRRSLEETLVTPLRAALRGANADFDRLAADLPATIEAVDELVGPPGGPLLGPVDLRDVRAALARLLGRPTCAGCGLATVADGDPCPGCDQCNHGPDGGPARPCDGWGRFCCRCGADYARGQLP